MEACTKQDAVYESVRTDIVQGNFRPGERLVISDLSKRYDTSPMPIREALVRLQQDGFIESRPHVGAFVSYANPDEFKEILLIRTELEALACRLSVPYMTEEIIREMQSLVDQMEVCVNEADSKGFSRLNKKYHMLIYCASPYRILQELIHNLWERTEFMRNIYDINMKRLSASHQEHKDWIVAFRDKDEKRVLEILHEQKDNQFAGYLQDIHPASR